MLAGVDVSSAIAGDSGGFVSTAATGVGTSGINSPPLTHSIGRSLVTSGSISWLTHTSSHELSADVESSDGFHSCVVIHSTVSFSHALLSITVSTVSMAAGIDVSSPIAGDFGSCISCTTDSCILGVEAVFSFFDAFFFSIERVLCIGLYLIHI